MEPSIEDRRAHARGTVLVLASALAFSLAGILTKSVDADAWTIVCWRGFVGGAVITAYVGWRGRGRPLRETFRLGWRGWLLATLCSIASILFISAFKFTHVANVTVIYATVPFIAALIERAVLGEPFSRSTLLAATASLAGVAIMVSGDVGGNFAGEILALLMTITNGLFMVLIRAFRSTGAVLAGAASCLQVVLAGAVLGDPFAVSAHDAWLLVLFGLAFAVAIILWTEGTRLVPAAESGLLTAADVPLATLLAWLVLADLPSPRGLVGGAVVLAAILALSLRNIFRERRPGLPLDEHRC